MLRVIYNNGKQQRSYTYFISNEAISEGRYRATFEEIFYKFKSAYKVNEFLFGLVINLPVIVPGVPTLTLKTPKSKSKISEVLEEWQKVKSTQLLC